MSISRNLVIFIVAVGLSVGAILVYANSVKSKDQANSQTLGANVDAVTPAQALQGGLVQGQDNSQTQQQGQQTQQGQQAQPQQSSNQSSSQQQQQQQNQQQAASQVGDPTSLPPVSIKEVTQLEIKDEKVGSGDAVKKGDTAEVNYIGTFLDGSKFDSSYGRHQTFSFQVGGGQVIKGWDEGLVGMQVGGKRLLIIPSDMAYGPTGSEGAIPPNTPLMFEIELVSIKP